MKFKYCFTLAVILIILFSLTTVVASENLTDGSNLAIEDNIQGPVNENLNEGLSSVDDSVDLSAWIDVNNTYNGKEYNRAGFEVIWAVTAKVNDGTAHNVKISTVLSDNMQFISHNKTIGEFNPTTGIWDIGDLSSSDDAYLTILVKLKEDGKFTLSIDATTDSNDIDLSNNWDSVYIRNGTLKSGSNTTETTDDVTGPQHEIHQGSEDNSGDEIREREDENSDTGHSNTVVQPRKKSDPNPDPGSEDGVGSNSKTKSLTNTISKSFGFLGNSIADIFNSDSSLEGADSNSNSAISVEAIQANDYTKIPMLIFVLFLIILVAIVAYDKVKS